MFSLVLAQWLYEYLAAILDLLVDQFDCVRVLQGNRRAQEKIKMDLDAQPILG